MIQKLLFFKHYINTYTLNESIRFQNGFIYDSVLFQTFFDIYPQEFINKINSNQFFFKINTLFRIANNLT